MSNKLTLEDKELIAKIDERLKALETLHEERIDSIESVQYVIDNFLKLSFKDNYPEFRQKVYKMHQEFLIKINDILKSKDRKTEDNLDLVKLETQLDEALSKETPETLTEWLLNKRKCEQPDNEVEEKEEYYKCLFWNGDYATEGLIYKQSGDPDFVIGNSGHLAYLKVGEWEKSTREAYLAQTTPVNGEWKKGEWAKKEDRCGLVIGVNDGYVEVDLQDGTISSWTFDRLEKPSPEQVETWLTRIAEKKYPVGTKVKEVDTDVEYTVTHEGIRYTESLKNLTFVSLKEEWGNGHSNPTIWHNGVWAETIKEVEQKERWLPKPMEIYWSIDDTFNAYKTVGSKANRVKAGNCFPTEEAATKAAQLIRETLKQL